MCEKRIYGTDPCAGTEFMALIHVGEKGILMDHRPEGWEKKVEQRYCPQAERWNKDAKRETVSSLISNKGKKTVLVLGH